MKKLTIKAIMITAILLAATCSEAYDVSILTVNKKTMVEIVTNNGTVCLFELTKEKLNSFSQTDAKVLVNKCLSK